MFLVTGRAGAIIHDVRLVETVFLVTDFTLGIDLSGRDSVSKAASQHRPKIPDADVGIVAFRAIVRKLGVTGRDFAGIKKGFVPRTLKEKNRNQAAENRDHTDDQSHLSPRVQPAIVTKIAFVALGDLLLRASGFRHRLSI